jgi:hypothetical protein
MTRSRKEEGFRFAQCIPASAKFRPPANKRLSGLRRIGSPSFAQSEQLSIPGTTCTTFFDRESGWSLYFDRIPSVHLSPDLRWLAVMQLISAPHKIFSQRVECTFLQASSYTVAEWRRSAKLETKTFSLLVQCQRPHEGNLGKHPWSSATGQGSVVNPTFLSISTRNGSVSVPQKTLGLLGWDIDTVCLCSGQTPGPKWHAPACCEAATLTRSHRPAWKDSTTLQT